VDEVARTTLKLFIEKAERLAKYVRENVARISIVVNPGGLIGVFRNSEEKEWQIASTLDGFLLTFRMFVQLGEGIALYPLVRDSQGQPKPQKPQLLTLAGLSPDWYEKVEQAYHWIDVFLVLAPPNIMYNDEPTTRRKILETFLYGDDAHAKPTANRETFEAWRRLPDLFGDLKFEYISILNFILGQILEVATACKHELSLNV
jgi:hypothetical protein